MKIISNPLDIKLEQFTQEELDVVLAKIKHESCRSREAYFSFECVSSDHRIVMAKICLSLHRNAAQTTQTTHYDLSLLNNSGIRDKYMITLTNKFDVLQETSETLTPNDKYENLEAAAECMPRAKHRVPWELRKTMTT